MRKAVKGYMLPDLIANCDDIELHAISRKQFEILTWIDDACGVERIVEQNRARLVTECTRKRFFIQTPMWRLQTNEFRHTPGPADQRRIRIIKRLEDNNFVARLDKGKDRGGNRFRCTRRHHHFGRPVEIELMPMCVMRSDRLTQF